VRHPVIHDELHEMKPEHWSRLLGQDRPFSISLRGVWSPRQARAVTLALEPELDAAGVTLDAVEITRLGDEHRRIILCPRCARCRQPLADGETHSPDCAGRIARQIRESLVALSEAAARLREAAE